MSDTTEAIKKYWPWVAGGVVGLIIIVKIRGGGSSDPMAGFYAAQSQAAQQSAILGAQAKAQDDAYRLGLAQIAGQQDIAKINAGAIMHQIDAQKQVGMADICRQAQSEQLMIAGQTQIGMVNAQANYTLAQGQAGLMAATGAAQLVAQLQAPAIAGINAAAAENIAAYGAAGTVAVGGFNAQAHMIQSTGQTAIGYANAQALQTMAGTSAINGMASSLSGQLGAAMKPTPGAGRSDSGFWGAVGTIGGTIAGLI